MIDIVNGCRAKVIREGLYIPGLQAGVFRPSPLPGEIKGYAESLIKDGEEVPVEEELLECRLTVEAHA